VNPADINGSPMATVNRLERATNAHDLEALVDCFEPGYRNDTPAHPARSFIGRDQVRANWQQRFAAVPDLHARVLAAAVSGDTVWTEWEMTGTRRDGAAHLMRGVIVFGVSAGGQTARIRWARFYLDVVEMGGGNIDLAVANQLGGAR